MLIETLRNNYSEIKIQFNEPWLPRDDGFKIRNPANIPDTIARVEDLIDRDTRWWKVALLEQFFEPEDVEVIKSIPLQNLDQPDRWVWHFTSSGQFTVRSAYHVAGENPLSEWHHHLQPLGFGENNKFWSRFWKMKTPKRALHFAWRFCSDSLPTLENLRKRTLEVSPVCVLCGNDGPTTRHLFFDCSYAQAAWSTAGISGRVQEFEHPRGEMWFRNMLRDGDDSFCHLVIMVCDDIWFQRNRHFFEQTHLPVAVMTASVVAGLRRFAEAQGWPESISASLLPGMLLRPPDEAYKIYFDAGVSQDAGSGVIALSPDGEFLRAATRRFPNIQDPVLGELLALEEALSMTDELNLPQICIIGDALQVIQMARNDAECPMNCEAVLGRVQFMLGRSSIVGPFWVPRSHNFIAHSLASFAKMSPLLVNAWVTPPSFLSFISGRFPEP